MRLKAWGKGLCLDSNFIAVGASIGGNISFLSYQSYGFIILGFVESMSWYVLEFGG